MRRQQQTNRRLHRLANARCDYVNLMDVTTSASTRSASGAKTFYMRLAAWRYDCDTALLASLIEPKR